MAVRRAFQRRRKINHGKAKRVRHWEPRSDPETLHEPVRVVVEAKLDRVRFAYGSMRQTILDRDKHRCRYCGVKVTDETANIDHVVPYDKNGQTTPANLVTACRDCNKAKGNKVWKVRPLKSVNGKPLDRISAKRPAGHRRRKSRKQASHT